MTVPQLKRKNSEEGGRAKTLKGSGRVSEEERIKKGRGVASDSKDKVVAEAQCHPVLKGLQLKKKTSDYLFP